MLLSQQPGSRSNAVIDLASDMERDATRERLAVMIVTLGKSCHEIDAVELQARALATFDQNGGDPPPPAGRAEIAPGNTCSPNSTDRGPQKDRLHIWGHGWTNCERR